MHVNGFGGISASNESLLVANSSAQGLVNSLITVELSAIEQKDNHGGFVINGVNGLGFGIIGSSISGIGDIDGDGLDDLYY